MYIIFFVIFMLLRYGRNSQSNNNNKNLTVDVTRIRKSAKVFLKKYLKKQKVECLNFEHALLLFKKNHHVLSYIRTSIQFSETPKNNNLFHYSMDFFRKNFTFSENDQKWFKENETNKSVERKSSNKGKNNKKKQDMSFFLEIKLLFLNFY